MIYFIICLIVIIALLPLVFSLASYVYRSDETKPKLTKFLSQKWFILSFIFLLSFWIAFSLVLLWNINAINPTSARLDVGCTVLFVMAVYFFRLIHIYYGEGSTVQSEQRYVVSFVKEVFAIVIFTAALLTVSFMFYAYIVSAAVGALALLWRVKKFIKLRKKYKGDKDAG